MTDIRSRDPSMPLRAEQAGKFAPKLSHQQRCAALCLYKKGAGWKQLASYFGVHYRVIQTIVTGPRYKEVRAEYQAKGEDQFLNDHYTSEVRDNFKAFLDKHYAESKKEILPGGKQSIDPKQPNWDASRKATKMEGIHSAVHMASGVKITYAVAWRDAAGSFKHGWYYGSDDQWTGPYATSTLAHEAARALWDPAIQNDGVSLDEEREVEALSAKAANARRNMEENPSFDTVDLFLSAAYAVYAKIDELNGEPQRTVDQYRDEIDWRDFDPTPYLRSE